MEGRNGRLVPCLAGVLLFGKDPLRWHPRCGIDFVRWEGTERRYGAELNVTKRLRLEYPLVTLIEKAYETIGLFIRERQQLHNLVFTERLEYPTFAWQEAIVNAIAHRDYSIQGAPIEVWLFDDHMEIRSPGLPPEPVTVDTLRRRQRLHLARNPLIVRVLADLGYMRDQGEGIPRMFEVMETEGFYPPALETVGNLLFQVTLRNEPIYDEATLQWLNQFRDQGLSGDQKRLLAYAKTHGGRFTNRDYQQLLETDLYGASQSIKELIRKGVVHSTGKGSRIYEIVEPTARQPIVPDELRYLLPVFQAKGAVQNKDVCQTLGVKPKTATRLLDRLVLEGWLERLGERRGTRYILQQTHI